MDSLIQSLELLALFLVGTSFLKLVCTFSILRFGLGLQGSGVGLIVVLLSLVLAVFSSPLSSGKGGSFIFSSAENSESLRGKLQPFLEKNADKSLVTRLSSLRGKLLAQEGRSTEAEADFPSLLAAFVLGELQEAFLIGFFILLPLLLIDLLVTNVFMLLEVTQLKASTVAVPLKILLFVAFEGWLTISERLMGTYIA